MEAAPACLMQLHIGQLRFRVQCLMLLSVHMQAEALPLRYAALSSQQHGQQYGGHWESACVLCLWTGLLALSSCVAAKAFCDVSRELMAGWNDNTHQVGRRC
jgi:hypothetical protein